MRLRNILTGLTALIFLSTCYALLSSTPRPHPPTPLLPHERTLTPEELQRCGAELASLASLKVNFGIAQMTSGTSLAVMKGADIVGKFLLELGTWESQEILTTFKEYDRLMAGRHRGTCTQPPCADKLFFDVGTNFGTWTFHAAQQGYDTISIEGSPPNFALLQLSKCLNPTLAPKINLVHSFVGRGTEYCLILYDLSNIGDPSLKCQDHEWTEAETAAIKVYVHTVEKRENVILTPTRTRKVDDVVAEALAAHPNFPNVFYGMKIDIESSELMAMRGAPRLLAGEVAEAPVIFSEMWYNMSGGPHPDAYFQHMRAGGYELRDPTCQTVWGPEQDAGIVERLKTVNIENVCFVRQNPIIE